MVLASWEKTELNLGCSEPVSPTPKLPRYFLHLDIPVLTLLAKRVTNS